MLAPFEHELLLRLAFFALEADGDFLRGLGLQVSVREKDAGGQSWVSLLAGGAPTAKGSSWMPFQVNAILCRALNCKSHVTTACAAADSRAATLRALAGKRELMAERNASLSSPSCGRRAWSARRSPFASSRNASCPGRTWTPCQSYTGSPGTGGRGRGRG